ncbi:MAG: TetR/AcrR family transcriptional regulator [Treponema sp.]|jgi:AcrR family transcriptional regulator|nr:TetR/AcrR family transcriptional regulator [Treponema sp.]
MSIVVAHEKRRKEVLEKVIDVFIDEGYENTTFQKIADHCGITRTTLYIYFKNKKEIFTYSIKLLLAKIDSGINVIRSDASLGSVEKITGVLLDIFRHLEENRRLLSVILDYLLHISKKNVDPETRVRRRVIKLRHILASLVIEGVKSGELKAVDIKTMNDYLYSLIEAAIFHLAILQKKNIDDLRKTAIFAVKQFAKTSV